MKIDLPSILKLFNSGAGPSGQQKYSKLIKYGIVAIAFLAIFIIGIMLMIGSTIKSIQQIHPTVISGPINASFSLKSSGALAYNLSRSVVEYASVHYAFYNATNATILFNVYKNNPKFKIYLLNVGSYCVQCPTGSSLDIALKTALAQYGLIYNSSSFTYVDINRVDSIPYNSTVIIPSGLIPNILLPNVTYTERCPKYSNSTIVTLLNHGDTIVYIGRNLQTSVTCSGQVVQTGNGTAAAIPFLINSTPARNFTNGSLHFNNPTFFFQLGSLYETAGYVKYSNGTFIALSNYFSQGWNGNVNLLASDIAKIIAARFWMVTIAKGGERLTFSSNYTANDITVFTLNSFLSNSHGVDSQVNSSYPALIFMLNNPNGTIERDLFMRSNFSFSGQINIPGTVGQGQQIQTTAQVFSTTGVITARMQLYDRNFNQVNIPPTQFGQVGPTPVFGYPVFEIPGGYYIAKLIDQRNNIYSKTLFYLSNATITPTNLDYRNGTFTFAFSSAGAPINSGAYNISLNGAYNTSGTISNGTVIYTLPKGAVVDYGTKTFSIGIFGNSYSLQYPYSNTGIVIPSLYIEFALAAVFIVVLNKILVPPNLDEYFIDVPDIRPIQKQQVKENSDSILDVFDKVNSYYHWNYMPLSVEEVRSGISNYVKYGNTKISITLNNSYAVMSKMISKGLIEECADYYTPKKWVTASGYSAEYLTIYRKLRDFCIANSLLFTELGTTDKADMIITSKGAQSYIKIYPGSVKIKQIDINSKVRTIFVFLDEDKKLLFIDKLYRSFTPNAEVIKMAVEYGNVILADSSELDVIK